MHAKWISIELFNLPFFPYFLRRLPLFYFHPLTIPISNKAMPHSEVIPPQEEPIYNDLTKIRQQLSIIKRDHSTFMNSKEINQIYQEVLTKLNNLKNVRLQFKSEPSSDEKTVEVEDDEAIPNKVDVLVDEIFQLLSLCFVTCGLSNTAPATYASLSTVQRLLEHLNESEIFTHHDLKPINERLIEIDTIISSSDSSSKDEINLLKIKLQQAKNEYNFLDNKINELPDDVQKLMDKLISIKYSLINLITNDHDDAHDEESNNNDNSNTEQISKITSQLDSIQIESNKLNNNKGEGLLKGLIDDCHNLINDLKIDSVKISTELTDIYAKLLNLKTTLENLLVTRRWTLRSTDIFNYQRDLNTIDNLRINGYFIKKELKGQTVLLYLLRRCYAIIYKLLESSEPVSESLQPLHNQLNTVRNCLLDLKRMGGVSSIRELYPYQLKLSSVDNLRIDGKFMINDAIPEGQGTLNALLAENFDILHELKMELYEREEEDASDGTNVSTNNKRSTSIIGTKALQNSNSKSTINSGSNYDYNNVGEDAYDEYDDNLASYNESINESEGVTTDAELN